MNVKYACCECGEIYIERDEAEICCHGGYFEVSECCGAEIYVATKYDKHIIGKPGDRYTSMDVPNEVHICSVCEESVE